MNPNPASVDPTDKVSDLKIFEPTEPVHFEMVGKLFSEYMIFLKGLPDVALNAPL